MKKLTLYIKTCGKFGDSKQLANCPYLNMQYMHMCCDHPDFKGARRITGNRPPKNCPLKEAA